MFRRIAATVLIVALLGVPNLGASSATKLRATSAPAISKTIAGGDKVVVTPAKWNQKVKVAYQWFAETTAIKGATTSSLKVGNELVGQQIRVRATAKNSSGKTAISFSNRVLVGDFATTGTLAIDFVAGSKDTLEAKSLPQAPFAGASLAYQWFRGGMDIEGATADKYTLATIDRGKTISLRVELASENHIKKAIYSNDVEVPDLARLYNLVWSDEFTGSGLADSNVWVAQEGDGVAYRNRGWGNKELQWYLNNQATQDGQGVLNIKATRTGADAYTCYYGTCTWLSSKLVTYNKVGFKYGRLEARIKAAAGEGTWAAFWTLGANIAERGWPGCGEIDVTELLGRNPNTTLGYLHGPLSGGGGRGDRIDTGSDLTTGYHTYAVDWLPDQVTWYVDGKMYAQVNKTDDDWVFDHEMYLILNLAMGGTLGGLIPDSLKDATMSVDYVRVYTIDGIGEVIRH